MAKKLQTIRSHSGYARWLATCDPEIYVPVGYLPRHKMPATPRYHSSPAYIVYHRDGKPVLAIETSHKVYEIWQVDASDLCATDEAATEAYMQSLKPAYSSLPIRYSHAGRFGR